MLDFQNQIRDAVSRYVKDAVMNAPAEHNIPVIQLESKISFINDKAEYDVTQRLEEDFGVTVSGMDIGTIEIDKTSEGYRQLMAVTKDIAAARTQAETTDYVERLRIQREEGQYALHKQTQSANIGAFQVEKQAEVGVAGANALGQMGANGAGDVDLGSGTGFNPAAMMAGMAVGGAVGQNIAGTMNNMMQNLGQSGQMSNAFPPSVPNAVYYVAINGQPNGPYELHVLSAMAANGQISAESLVWKQGMPQWRCANEIEELKEIFTNAIPPIPSDSNVQTNK